MYKHTHKGMHTRLHTHTPPVVGACGVREAGLSVAPDSRVGCAATTEGTVVEGGTQGKDIMEIATLVLQCEGVS